MQRLNNELDTDDRPRVLRLDCGGCSGCHLETARSLLALSEAGRIRVLACSATDRVDVLLLTGALLRSDAARVRRFYQHGAAEPIVVAVGACSLSGGVFAGAYGVAGGASNVIPVDVFVPGCPPRVDVILDGILQSLRALHVEPPLKIPA